MTKLPAAFCAILACTSATFAQTPSDTKYVPAQTTVAILPVWNHNKANDDTKARQIAKVQENLGMQFSAHGFKVVDSAAVGKAMSDLQLDATADSTYTAANLDKIGQALGANLVCGTEIVTASQSIRNKWLMPKREGKATLKLWLGDTASDQLLINGTTTEAKASASEAAIFGLGAIANGSSGSVFTFRALGNGVNDLLKDFMKPYPLVTKTANQK